MSEEIEGTVKCGITECGIWMRNGNRVRVRVRGKTTELVGMTNSVVTDSESATESADSSRVRPSPNPRIFCGHK